jgi:hypothetical protein
MQNFMFAFDKNKLYTIRKFAKKCWYIRRHVLKAKRRNETTEMYTYESRFRTVTIFRLLGLGLGFGLG